MFSRKKVLLVAVLATLTNGAFATGTAEQIKSINEDVAVLSARLAEIEVRAKIAGKQQEIDRIGGQSAESAPKDLPVVRSIEGADGKLRATLATGGGSTQNVIKGDKVGEWTVNKIDANSVVLARGKQLVRLGFGSEPPINPASTQGGITPPGYPAGIR